MEHGKDCACTDCVDWRIALETRRTGVCARCQGVGSFQVGLVNEATTRSVRCPCQGARLSDLATRLQQLSGTAFESALEAALHQTWDDGWHEHEKSEPGRNPYNVLTRVPEEFLKTAMEIATARSEFLEKNLDQHLFPGLFKETDRVRGSERLMPTEAVLFPVREIPLSDVVLAVEKLRDAPLPTLEDRLVNNQPCGCPEEWFEDRPELALLPHGYELPGKERTEVAHHSSCPKYFADSNGEPDSPVRYFCGICCYSYERCDCAQTGRR